MVPPCFSNNILSVSLLCFCVLYPFSLLVAGSRLRAEAPKSAPEGRPRMLQPRAIERRTDSSLDIGQKLVIKNWSILRLPAPWSCTAEDVANKPKANLSFLLLIQKRRGKRSRQPPHFILLQWWAWIFFDMAPSRHAGALVRVPIHDDAQRPSAPPYKLVPNSESLLGSKPIWCLLIRSVLATAVQLEGEDKKQFHGFDEDIESVGQFIHLYTTRYNRWQSPRFLIGESYGTLARCGTLRPICWIATI